MKYERIKTKIDELIAGRSFLRKIFYMGLNLLLLRAWYVRDEIKKFLRLNRKENNVKVLDAGCGFGQYSYFMAKRFKNAQVIGLDINEGRIKEVEKFIRSEGIENLKFEVADLTELNYSNEFDLVLAIDVMEHIRDDDKVLRNFYKALKEGGMIIISTPSNFGGSDVHSEEDESFVEEHVRSGYEALEIKMKLERVGFRDVKVRYAYGKWGALSWKLIIKFPISLLGKGFAFVFFLPLYYLVVLIPGLLLMWLDKMVENERGTGLIVTAKK